MFRPGAVAIFVAAATAALTTAARSTSAGPSSPFARCGAPISGVMPDWSPTGNEIAYAHVDSADRWAIWKVKPDGTDRRRVTADSLGDERPAWSPDGQEIAFDTGTTAHQVFVVNARGGSPELLTTGGEPRWFHDGARLVVDRAYRQQRAGDRDTRGRGRAHLHKPRFRWRAGDAGRLTERRNDRVRGAHIRNRGRSPTHRCGRHRRPVARRSVRRVELWRPRLWAALVSQRALDRIRAAVSGRFLVAGSRPSRPERLPNAARARPCALLPELVSGRRQSRIRPRAALLRGPRVALDRGQGWAGRASDRSRLSLRHRRRRSAGAERAAACRVRLRGERRHTRARREA